MPSQGPNSGATIVSDSSFGSAAWINPGNAAVEDGSITNTGTGTLSEYLKATNFGFSIPSGVINGILVEIKHRDATGTAATKDIKVCLVKAGVVQATNKADPTGWPASLAYMSYGSSSDTWGDVWTPSDINNSTFGVVLSSQFGLPSVDIIRITVFYGDANFQVKFQHA